MPTRRYDQMTKEEKDEILLSPEGIDRLLSLQKKGLALLRGQVGHVLTEIRDVESNVVSWVSLIIILGLLQVFQVSSNFQQQYIFLCLPSFILSFMSAALTLRKHPNYIMSDFFTTEDENKQLQYELNEAETSALTTIFQNLVACYNSKKEIGKYIGGSVLVNFVSNIVFLVTSSFVPKSVTNGTSILLGFASIVVVYLYTRRTTRSLNISYQKKL